VITSEFDSLSQIINEIDAASEEQAAGVKQINIALSQIEKSTQANAAVSEESAASAATLKNQVDDLLDVYSSINRVVEGENK
jgi:methyl-accepting chemotaxis protein